MTVIAWDGKTLAADRRSVVNGTIRGTTKISRHPERLELIAITGSLSDGLEVRNWYLSGAAPEGFPATCRQADNFSRLIVIREDGVFCYEGGPIPIKFDDQRVAFGSGADFAMAAMYLGRNAGEAVQVACALSSECGNGIDTLEFQQ
jgi:hypothetical protein